MSDEPGIPIGELARFVGMTPRNVRAHQSRGLLSPPTMRGRTGYYDGTHISRLLLIKELQDHGLNLRTIGTVLEHGDPITTVLRALRGARPGSEDAASRVTLPASTLRRLNEVDPSTPDVLCEHGLLERGPDGTYTADAAEFAAGARLFEAGMPVADMVRVQLGRVRDARGAAAELAQVFLVQAGGDEDQARAVIAEIGPYAVQMLTSAFEAALTAALQEKPGGVAQPARDG